MDEFVAFKFNPTDTLRVARALREAALTRKWQNNPVGEISYSALAECVERRLLAYHDNVGMERLAHAIQPR